MSEPTPEATPEQQQVEAQTMDMLAFMADKVDPTPEPPADALIVANTSATDPNNPPAPGTEPQSGDPASGDPVTQVQIAL
jgi:hypothetical protein